MSLNISFKIQAIDDFTATMSSLEAKTQKAFKSAGELGKGFTVAGAAVAAGLGYAVKTSMDFNAQMSRVGAISGATGKDFEALRQTALDLGASTSKSASEVAIGMEEMAKKGFEVNDVMSAMPGIIAAAEASGTDMATVANVTAAALNSFHLEASEATRVADVMAMTANKSSADVTDLGYAFKYAAPIANTLGYSMETLAAATGIMTDAGLEGSQAGTSLRMALIRLTDAPEEASKKLDQLGVSVTDANGNMLPFDNIIQQLAESTKGMGNAAKLAALSTIFGAEAASGMLTIIDAGPDKLRSFTKELENSGGSAAKTAAIMKDNLKGALLELQGAFETMLITVGSALEPAIKFLAQGLTKLVNVFNGLPSSLQTTVAVGLALLSVFLLISGPILILVALIPSVVAGFSALAAAFGVASSTLLIGIGAFLAIGAAVVALIAGLVLAYQKVGWFRDMVNSAFEAIKIKAVEIFNGLVAIITPAFEAIKAFVMAKLAEIKAFWDQHGTQVVQAIQNAFTVINTVIQAAMSILAPIFRVGWMVIVSIVQSVWIAIQNVINGSISIIMGIIKIFTGLFTADLGMMWDGVKQLFLGALQFIWGLVNLYFIGRLLGPIKAFGSLIKTLLQAIWNFIKSLFTNSINAIANIVKFGFNLMKNSVNTVMKGIETIIKTVLNAAKSIFTTVLNAMKNIVVAVFNGIRTVISTVMNAIGTVIKTVWNTIKTTVSTTLNTIKTTVTNAFNAIKTAVTTAMKNVVNAIKTGWNNAVSFLKGIDLTSIGKNIIQGLINGIGSMAGAAVDKVRGIANDIKGAIQNALDIHSPSRWMRDMIGKNMLIGFQVGLDKERRSTLSKVAEMTNWMKPAAPTIPQTDTSAPYAATRAPQQQQVIYLTVSNNFDGDDVWNAVESRNAAAYIMNNALRGK